MKLAIYKLVLLLYLIFSLTACGTVISFVNNDYSVYAGVRKDFLVLQDGEILSVLAVIDLPLSFVLDTLLLPITLNQ